MLHCSKVIYRTYTSSLISNLTAIVHLESIHSDLLCQLHLTIKNVHNKEVGIMNYM